jgi:hypothetical protein
MADGETPQSKRTGDRPSWIGLAVTALAAVALIAWLATRREPAPVVVDEPADITTTDADDTTAIVVTPEELTSAARLTELRGQDIRIQRAEVISALGEQLFWLQLPHGSLFLVKLDSTLVSRGTAAPASGHYQVVGRMYEKTSAVLDHWRQSGVLTSEGHRQQAEYGVAYIEARRLQPAGS